jgi:type IV pilus assembly protein PilC
MAQKVQKKVPFIWEGKDRTGKSVGGEILAINAALAKVEIRRRGSNPLKIRKKSMPLFSGGAKKKKITTADISIFFRQLATMMSSGIPLVQSFEIVGNGNENPSMKELILQIKSDLEGGGTMGDAFRKHPNQFDELSCNLIAAGEQAGILEGMLGKIAHYKEKSESLKAKVKKAMTYPITIITIALGITMMLLIFVIPQFQAIFAGFGADLPALTLIMIQASEFLQAYWWIVLGGIYAVVQIISQLKKKSPAFARGFENMILRIPVVGDILIKSAIARFARTLGTMFSAGVPLVEAMESVAGAVGIGRYKDAVLIMKDEITSGTSLTESMIHANLFPTMVVQMTSIGEEAGSIDSMLEKVADFYEEEVDNLVDNLSSLMEPLIMVVLGGIVGTIVMAMYLPIFKMGTAI